MSSKEAVDFPVHTEEAMPSKRHQGPGMTLLIPDSTESTFCDNESNTTPLCSPPRGPWLLSMVLDRSTTGTPTRHQVPIPFLGFGDQSLSLSFSLLSVHTPFFRGELPKTKA
ncbi:hypothetical protein BDW68DRAFT_170724 [Aspergillus falconensis]